MTTHWCPRQLSALRISEQVSLPKIELEHLRPISEVRYFWDQCPVLDSRGDVYKYQGSELWIALSAPVTTMAATRHEQARLRLLARRDQDWVDCGNLLPQGFSPGSREWAGVVLVNDADEMTVFYTAAGTAGEHTPTYGQRMFEAVATLVTGESIPRTKDWADKGELIQADGTLYQVADDIHGEPGSIKAFRDPFYFPDAESGKEYLLFSASNARARTEKNGAVGIAVADPSSAKWVLQDPVIDGDGVSNELERPHVIHHGGSYYLFWSTHGWTIADGIRAPTGLYGMVADSLVGPYEPINGTGLVVANPIDRPYQAYSWWVSNDLSVSSFVDMLDGKIEVGSDSPRYPIGKFEGTIAPEFHLRLDGARAWIDKEIAG